jgi:2,4-dienoyl-CoA reductase-like NADH-dependent reductase (Old Yellow Enzyme family)
LSASPRFPNLFSPLAVGGVEIANRILSTGHMTMLARDGRVTPDLVAYHAARAAGAPG